MNPTQLRNLQKIAVQPILPLKMCGTSTCQGQRVEPILVLATGSIVGVNYTAKSIQAYRIDGAYGSTLGSYSGGGGHI
jgi:hypothetical protein